MQKGSKGRFSFLFIGESTGLPPMWPRRRPHLWVEFVVSSCPCSERFFSGYDCFRLSSNQHFQITIQSGMHGLTSSWVPSIPQNSGLKFWKFHVPNKTAHSGCTDPTQATAFGYCSCKQDTKEQYWGQQFCQMERNISVRPTEMTRPVKVDHPQSTNINGPFNLMYQLKSPEFWVEWKAPLNNF